MKKFLFIIALAIFSIIDVSAFDIDVNKIDINSRSNSLTKNLNKTYKIDTEDFNKTIINNDDIQKLSKELVKISLSDDDVQTKREKITDYMYLSRDNGFDNLSGSLFIQMYVEQLEKNNIKAGRIRDIKTVAFNEGDIMSFVYLADATVDGKEKDVILVYWFKLNNNEYKVYYPWMKTGDDLNEYFKKVTNNEENGIVIGDSYNQVSLTNNENINVSKELLNKLYNDNKNSVVQLTGMKGNGSNTYGSGFFLREGIIVTTWSLFLQFLTESNYIYVNDVNGNNYEILGVVAAQIDYDVVVLKVSENVGKGVELGNTGELKVDDKLFMINSKTNGGFSINYGSFMSLENGKMKNMFLLNKSDVGGALFNSDGKVVGINVGDQLNSELSFANSTDYLKKLQEILNKQDYKNITYTIIETFKQSYYISLNEEREYNTIDSDIWNKFKMVGNIEEKINLPLVKGFYKDEILCLRYKNKVGYNIDSVYLLSDYTEELNKSGYKLTYEDKNKMIYKSNKYKVIIKSNLNYIIILIMEI